MTRIVLVAFGLIALVLGSGCLRRPWGGHFTDHAFYQARGQYRVRVASPGRRELLARPWRIDGFSTDARGQPLREIVDRRFIERHDFSWHPGGRRIRPVRARRYDFVYLRGEDAAIWARSLPVRTLMQDEPLAFVLSRSIGAIGRPEQDVLGIVPHVGAHVDVVSHECAVIDGEPAEIATFDLHMSGPEGGVIRRVTAAIVRPEGAVWSIRRVEVPGLIVFGVASKPNEHVALRHAFDEMLARVDFSESEAHRRIDRSSVEPRRRSVGRRARVRAR